MNDTGISKHDQVLAGLVITLQAAVMQHLGKMKSPVTDTVERDLQQARATIDILEMLKVKCREGTPAEILRLLDGAVMELQMNFLDELRKDHAAAAESAGETAAESAGKPAGEPAGEPAGADATGADATGADEAASDAAGAAAAETGAGTEASEQAASDDGEKE